MRRVSYIKNFDCDFVVITKLNRGSKDGRSEVLPPEFFVLPVDVVRAVPRTVGWGKVSFSSIPQMEQYRDGWHLIRDYLKRVQYGSNAKALPQPVVSVDAEKTRHN